MIIIVSPSKTQYATLAPNNTNAQPPLMDQASILVRLLRQLDRKNLSELMNISEKLTNLTHERICDFTTPHTTEKAGNALTTFQGDAFSAIGTGSYSPDDFQFANTHLRILSGLYGYVRPLDLMQPYRLEMGTKLLSDRGKNLYEFWGTIITEALNADLTEMEEQVIVDCASHEYSRVLQQKQLIGSMIRITFRQKKDSVLRSIAIHAKRARGMFVDYIIKKRINGVDRLTEFNAGGYSFAPDLSSSNELVFVAVFD